VVIVLAGDPPAPPGSEQLFEGDALTYYGRWTYKLEEAARRGAAAVLLVHTPDLAGYDWNVVRTGWSGAVVSLRDDSAAVAPRVSGWLSTAAARRLLESAGLDFDQLFVRAARRDFTPVLTDTKVRVQAAGELRSIVSTNVAALLPGGDERYRTEVVVYTAHHDALGVGPPTGGDAIYNGAYDNAGGVAQLLEIAKAFTELRGAPDRSILFLATAAEEAGMLGATYYTRHPLVPLERTIAVLNLEGANFWGETDDVSAVGIERSTLGAVFSRAAGALRLRATPERAPAHGFFYRSDHFPFARAGIPAVSLDHGISFRNRPPEWGARTLSDFLARAYHTPLDQLPENADLGGAAQQVRFAFLLGYDLANDRERPRYYDDVRPLPPPAALRPAPASKR
jgi:Zn-dependent M28 family amino/carboxypeptidase